MDNSSRGSTEGTRASRWAGLAVRAAGFLGAAVSILLMAASPFLFMHFRDNLQRAAAEAAGILSESSSGVRQAGGAVGDMSRILTTVVDTLESTSNSLDEIEEFSSTAYTLLNDQIPQTLEDTEAALEAVEEASGEIDSVLSALDAVSFLTGVEYDPDKPLDEAVEGVASSLDPISESMKDISQSLSTATDELSSTSESVGDLAGQLDPYEATLENAGAELDQLAETMADLSEKITGFQDDISSVMMIALILFELLMLWGFLGQVAVYQVGAYVMIQPQDDLPGVDGEGSAQGGLHAGQGG